MLHFIVKGHLHLICYAYSRKRLVPEALPLPKFCGGSLKLVGYEWNVQSTVWIYLEPYSKEENTGYNIPFVNTRDLL